MNLGTCGWPHIWGPLGLYRLARERDGPTQRFGALATEAAKRNYSSPFGASPLLSMHQKLPGISAFFITRVNICHVNKARGYFSPLRNRICNDTALLMSPRQYNMYLNADERQPVRPGLRRQGVELTRCMWEQEALPSVASTWESC